MKELIIKLLTETKFNKIEDIKSADKSCSSIYSENEDKNMFYIASFYESIGEFKEKFDENQNEGFNFICSKKNLNELKKNTSMILFIKLKDLEERNEIQSKILELEEDVYFFKKYIVLYLDQELEVLRLETEDKSINEFMKENINNESLFEDFKKNENSSFYSLILKLYIKLPHLTYSSSFKMQNIQDLSKKIIDRLELEDIANLHHEILNIEEKNIDSWISEIINIQ